MGARDNGFTREMKMRRTHGAVRGLGLALLAVVGAAALMSAEPARTAGGACGPPIVNPVACENTKPGNPSSEWDVAGEGDSSIQGFATDISVDQGQTVHFKVKTDANDYHVDLYRLGYYAGDGARKVATVQPSAILPQNQPACLSNSTTGLLDCGNWAESASWTVPSDAVSGIYIARLVRGDTGGASHIAFVVRDDDGNSNVLFQTSDTTWQAYNQYGGRSLYVGPKASKVSYNRPFTTRGTSPEDWVFNAEYPMVRWLEANGYDVSYSSDVDTDRRGAELLEHRAFMSVGHDEYWSAGQRANVEAARAAGVNLAFFSGNEIYWKTRWEASIDGAGTPNRTLVTYKEGTLGESACGGKCDPDPNVWTGLWRDGCSFSPPADGCRPENALSGEISWVGSTGAIDVPAADGKMRFWRNTSIANLPAGQIATLPDGTLGYEWDFQQYENSYPDGRIWISTTSLDGRTHHLSVYRAASGALVFGAGTVQWSWGLDANHDRGSGAPDGRMRQATVNLLADMGVQPATLQPGLVVASASTDTVAPATQISAPSEGATLPSGSAVTISGTASDSGVGVVGVVEVSVDGGSTWQPASGRENWSYSWTPSALGPAAIMSRAVDDSGNVGAAATRNVTVEARSCPCSIWSSSTTPAVVDTDDNNSVELGVRFRSDTDGFIGGIRFYKASTNTGTHVGRLWSNTGTKLAEATFSGESGSGWQQVTFGTPVAISANTTYVASYHTNVGHYSHDSSYFGSSGTDNPPLHALQNGADGANGVYLYGAGGFPTDTFNASNYWVDVVFSTTSGSDTTPPTVSAVSPADGATGVASGSNVSASFSEPMDASTIDGSSFQLRDSGNNLVPASVSYDAGLQKATLDPTGALAPSSTYTATVKGGAGGVTDSAGNQLAADYGWSFTTAGPSLTDTSVADFNAGTLDANTYIADTGDGEVILKPQEGSEFFGSSLPSGWSSAAWSAGGSASVGGGTLTLDGAYAGTNALYGPGRSLEFVATFGAAAFQHAGFGVDYNNTPYWAMFSTNTGGGLYARTNNNGSKIDTLLSPPESGSWLGTPHRFRIDWTASAVVFSIDGAQVASQAVGITANMRPLLSDFAVGGPTLGLDWVRMSPYPGSGSFLSRILDGGASVSWGRFSWDGETPAGTTLALSVRTGNTPTPDASWSAFTPVPSSGAAVGRSSRYLQYRAELASSNPDQTPVLQDVSVEYGAAPTTAHAVADFNGDGKTDVSVWRPSEGRWYTLVAPFSDWGVSGDVPVPADYDGNGTTDVAAWRPSEGRWYVKGGSFSDWGVSGDVPVPADYDGDGKADIAIFRPSEGRWYIKHSSDGGITVSDWGVSGDIPVPADYDGDGKADIAIFRPSEGRWYVLGAASFPIWGVAGDIPVPADYNGDGKTDVAVYRPSEGRWYDRDSGTITSWGIGSDRPEPGDYNGDGTADLAVFRPEEGRWYVKDGAFSDWGLGSDVQLPLPHAIRRVFFP